MKDSLSRQNHLQALMIEVYGSLIGLPSNQVSDAIRMALGKIASFVQMDRAFVFDYDFKRKLCRNTFEWCAHGIEPQIDRLQAIPLGMIPEWVEPHHRGESVAINDVNALPSSDLKDLLILQQIKSTLAVPMMLNGECQGFVGYDAVRRQRTFSITEQMLLLNFGQALQNLRRFQKVEEALMESRRQYFDLTEEAPVGIISCDRQGKITYANPAVMELVGAPSLDDVLSTNLLAFELLVAQGLSGRLAEAMQKKTLQTHEMFFESSWGKKTWLRIHFKPYVDDGEVTGARIILDDITARKEAEIVRNAVKK
ncbi:MAG: PAS domain S-box protein [Bacillota bacterium]|nr:PAS domain S-box protein [Bacillota bacterium]MDW7678211.1 PAS domain S-box protein [Bacillota bacterium]